MDRTRPRPARAPAPGSGHLDRALSSYQFAVSGWDERRAPDAGGVFWVEQGRASASATTTGTSSRPGRTPSSDFSWPSSDDSPTSPSRRSARRRCTRGCLSPSTRAGAVPTRAPVRSGRRSAGTDRFDRARWSYNRRSWSRPERSTRPRAEQARSGPTWSSRSDRPPGPSRTGRRPAGPPTGGLQRDLLPQPAGTARRNRGPSASRGDPGGRSQLRAGDIGTRPQWPSLTPSVRAHVAARRERDGAAAGRVRLGS